MMVVTSVSFSPCTIAGPPRVAYRVTTETENGEKNDQFLCYAFKYSLQEITVIIVL